MRKWITNRYVILVLLTALNTLNYIDRYVPSGALPLIREDFSLSRFQGGTIHFVFLLTYTIIAPIVAFLGDQVNRVRWIFISGFLWSIATTGAFWAPNYEFLLGTRAVLGMGEAVFGVLSATMVLDLFSQNRRGFMLSILYMAMPIGGALGYIIGGNVGSQLSWRWAFLVVGLPGLLISLLVLFVPEPDRGQYDEGVDPTAAMAQGGFQFSDLGSLFTNKAWVLLVLGLACASWVQGGLSWWVPEYYEKSTEFGLEKSSLYFGAATALGGFIAIPLGGYLSDVIREKTDMASALVSGSGIILGAIPTYFAITYLVSPYMWIFAFGAIVGVFLNTGPIYQAVMEVVPVYRRAAAVALCMFCMHMLGDVVSPVMIGGVADYWNFETAMLLAVPYMLTGGTIWLIVSFSLPEAIQKALEQSSNSNPD